MRDHVKLALESAFGIASPLIRRALAGALGLALAACTPTSTSQAPPPGPAVSPGQVFPGDNLTVTWPASEGWHLADTKPTQWSFAKRGTQPDETYGAIISWHDLPPDITTPREFEIFVKQAADADNANRFANLRSAAEFSEARPYPCVNYRALGQAAPVPGQPASAKPLLLEELLLVCKNPMFPSVAFAAAYSHRGAAPDPHFDDDAANFFAGIQVPGH